MSKPSHAEQPWYSIRLRTAVAAAALAAGATAAAAAAPSQAEIFIYGDIGESWYAETVTAKAFVQEIAALDVDKLVVRINSYGGSVAEGITIYNALKRHRASVTVTIDGIAASIASLIAMAGDTVEIADNALLMIHAPWGAAVGNAALLREYADLLDTWSTAMATSYAAKTGRPVAEIMGWLTDGKDHWFTAADAVTEKLADTTIAAVPALASAVSRFAWAAHTPGAASFHHSVQVTYQDGIESAAGFPTPTQHPSLPAAAAATLTENSMSGNTNPQAATEAQAALEAATAAGVRAEAQRRSDIAAEFRPFVARGAGMPELQAACEADVTCTVDAAKGKILAALAKGAEPVAGGYVATLEAEADKQRNAIKASLEARADLIKPDAGNPFRSYSLVEIARVMMAHKGVKTEGLDKMGLIAVAMTHSTSDFPLFLANVAEKSMLKGYEEAEETFPIWTTRGTLPDYKSAKRVDLGSIASLPSIAEGAEYTFTTIGERGETQQLAKYGRRLALSREAILNDDLNGFSRLARKLGRAAIRTIGDLVYLQLTSNPTMGDGVALFHATHANLNTAAALNTASVDAMRTGMALQKDVSQTTSSLNLDLAYLLVPKALQGTAKVVRDAEYEVTSGAAGTKNNTVPNSQRGTFEVIADARLDAASSTNWYGTASPGMHDTVEVSYLDGNDQPTLEQQAGWSVDGMEWKVRMEAGVKALDWRTMAKNPI